MDTSSLDVFIDLVSNQINLLELEYPFNFLQKYIFLKIDRDPMLMLLQFTLIVMKEVMHQCKLK